MALAYLQGTLVNTVDNLPALDIRAPDFSVTKLDLSGLTLEDLVNKVILLDILLSIDTGVCAASVRRFNIKATAYPDVIMIDVSQDLSSVLRWFYDAEGIERVITISGFRSSFGTDCGVELTNSPMAGLLARTVVIIGAGSTAKYTELAEDIAQNSNFETAPVPL